MADSNFIDYVKILCRSGKGGAGSRHFHRAKYVPKGGPDGGDGGNGGSVYLRADSRLLSLYDFRLKRVYEAQNGQPGRGGQCDGKKGADLVLGLPVGTLVFAEGVPSGEAAEGEDCAAGEDAGSGERLLADLSEPESLVLVARGGRGGKGNEHFKSSTMRAPRFAQPGEPGEEVTLRLELKILADAGLIGLPNAGKSTFISRVSAARPKIADYPFTTITPNLGVMIDEVDPEKRMIIADIPGLIEGAHAGLGLGHRFLRHVERTRFLVHMLSIDDVDDADPWAGFELVNEELRRFDPELAERRQIEVINKIDLVPEERLQALMARAAREERRIFFISAKERIGLEPLVEELWRLKDELARHEPLVHFHTESPSEDEEFPEIEVVYTNE